MRVQKPLKPAVSDILIGRTAEGSANVMEPFSGRALLTGRTDEVRDLAIGHNFKKGLVTGLGAQKRSWHHPTRTGC